MTTQTNGRHRWEFFRAGGFDQVRIRSGADLANLDKLDQKLWVALACPTRGLEFDSKTLDLIDADKDGRIRAPEMIAAVKWACDLLKNPDELVKPTAALPLASINDQSLEGKQMLASAKQILANLGKADADSISVEDTTDTQRIFSLAKFNGDGIVPPDAAGDEAVKSVIADAIACEGGETDRSGKPGITSDKLGRFYNDLQAFSDWSAKAATDAATILPLGDKTASAAAAVLAVKTKVDDYFSRCKLAAFDARAIPALNRDQAEYGPIAAKDLTPAMTETAAFPLATIEPGKPLPLSSGINPAWATAIAALRDSAVTPILGEQTSLTPSQWEQIQARLAPYVAWQSSKAGANVEKLGPERIKAILAEAGPQRAAVVELIDRDKALESDFNAIAGVDKLARFNRDLAPLLKNFVNFQDFYSRKEKAVFQAGRLFLDQRSCELCIRVEDAARHAAMAPLSQAYLAYCDVVRKSTGEKMTIAAAITDGDSDNLMVGRNGVFYDRQGRDWDSTITKIVDNPISIRQAFFAPYKRLIRYIQEQVAKRAAAADAASQAHLQGELTAAVDSAGKPLPPKPAEPPKKLDTGTVAALGVALGFITTAFASLLGWLTGAGWMIPIYIVLLLLAISGPSMIIAWLKLRQRNLGPILDANGWAVNAKAKINIPFGRSLTGVAKLPPGSKRDMIDPFAEKKTGRWVTAGVIVAFLIGWAVWYFGGIERIWPGVLPKSGYIERREKLAAEEQAKIEAEKARLAPPTSQPATTQPGQ